MNKKNLKNYLKFFFKWKFLRPIRALFFLFFSHKPNFKNWESRILIVNLHALGDVVAMTSVLQQYKEDFPNKKIFFLVPDDLRVTGKIFDGFVDEILFVDLKKFGSNLFYELKFLNNLKNIGFETIVNQGYGTFEIPGKIISISLGAKNIIGYEGPGIETSQIDWVMRRKIKFVRKVIFSSYTKVIPSIDPGFREKGRASSFPSIYASIYEALLTHPPKPLPTKIVVDPEAEKSTLRFLEKNHIQSGNYVVFVMGGRTPARWWPVEKFGEVAKVVHRSGVPIVVVGTRKEKELSSRLEEISGVPVVDSTGQLSVAELISIINHCLLVIANDTAPTHLAIALKKPSICVMGPALLGISDHYGYPGINRWVWEKTDCIFDYWQCIDKVKPGKPAPCIDAVKAEKVIDEFNKLAALLKENTTSRLVSDDRFELEFKNID